MVRNYKPKNLRLQDFDDSNDIDAPLEPDYDLRIDRALEL